MAGLRRDVMRRLLVAATIAFLCASALPTASQAANTPRPGAPCPQAGMTYQLGTKWLQCQKRKGKLIWVVVTGGNEDILDQPVPANGVWKVAKGFPTDLPPFGWRGEPSWFRSEWEMITTQPIGKCASATPLKNFAADLTGVKAITGQGFMQPGSHALPVPHMYYATLPEAGVDEQGFATLSKRVDVYAPADMTLRGLGTSITSADGRPRTEYILNFSVCGTLWFFTAHLGSLNSAIASAYAKAPRKECFDTGITGAPQSCLYSYLSVKVKAGTVIGRSSGYSAGFDFGLADASSPIPGRLDPAAYSPRWSTSRCHLDYYPAAMRSQLTALLVGDNGCGQLGSDQAGTASGVWLAVGKRDLSHRENLHIALAKHWSDKSLRVISIGWEANVPGVPGARYVFTPSTTGNNRDFTLVKPGEVVCYDNLDQQWPQSPSSTAPAIYISVTTGTVEQIHIGGASGACPTNPTMPAQFQTFERRNTAS